MADARTIEKIEDATVVNLEEKVWTFVDENIQDDLSNVHECLERMKSQRNVLKSQLLLNSSESQSITPLCVDDTLDEASGILLNVDEVQSKLDELSTSVKEHDTNVATLVDQLTLLNNTVKEIKHLCSYVKWIQRVEEHSAVISRGLESGSLRKATDEILKLKAVHTELSTSLCTHLKQFVAGTLKHWNKILVTKLSKEFDEVLKGLKWPFTSGSTAPPLSAKPEVFKRLENLFVMLLNVSDVDNLSNQDDTKAQVSTVSLPIRLLLAPLKKRFLYHFSSKKQTNNLEKPEWFYTQVLNWIRDHEDFLNSTIQPIVDNAEELHFISVQAQFTEGLLEVVEDKMKQTVPLLLNDDAIFSHFVDETLLFDQELRSVYNYSPTNSVCLKVLSQEQCFKKWATLEKRFAMENVQSLLSSDKAWSPRYQDASDIDDLKVPECVETFVSLLLAITDRFRHLPQEKDRLTFVEIQLDLIFFFTSNLEDVMEQNATTPLNACFLFILNSTNYVVTVLQDWAEQALFLKLYYEKRRIAKKKALEQERRKSSDDTSCEVDENHSNQAGALDNALSNQDGTLGNSRDNQDDVLDNQDGTLDNTHDNQDGVLDNTRSNQDGALYLGNEDGDIHETKTNVLDSYEELSEQEDEGESGTLFDEAIEQLRVLQHKMLAILVKHVLLEFKTKSDAYKKESWHSLPSRKQLAITCLSSSLCDMVIFLRDILGNLKQEMVDCLFTCFWKQLADDLSEFFVEEIILTSHFNEGGAAQFKFDIHKNLFVLFGQFTPKPDNYFRRLKEAIILLNLSPGSAILLRETLEDSVHKKNNDKATLVLDELGVYRLTVSQVLNVLSSRINRTK